ncbi:MAG: C25 family cysteine peptidase [Anaerolineae bacterium]
MKGIALLRIVNVSLGLLLVFSTITAPPISAEHAPAASERPPARLSPAPTANPNTPDNEPPGVRVVASDAGSITLELITPAYRLAQNEDDFGPCTQLVVDGYSGTGASGAPELPVKGTMVGIPAQGEATLTVVEVEAITAPETYAICPVGRPIVETSPSDEPLRYQGEERVRDAIIYATAGFTPTEPAVLLSTGFIRSQRVAQLQFRPFQYNPVTGQLRFARRIRVQLTFDTVMARSAQIASAASAATTGTVDEGAFEEVLRTSLVNYEGARGWRAAPQQRPATNVAQWPLSDEAYKILVDADGIYQLTYTDLIAAGVPVNTLDPRTLKLHNQGIQVAIYVEGEADGVFNTSDYVLFYGQKMTTKYTDVNVYWLTWGGESGLRMGTSDGTPGGAAVPEYFRTTQRIEQNRIYQAPRPSGPDNDHWYWYFVWATTPQTFTASFSLTHPLTTSMSAIVSGLFKGYDAIPQHHTRVYLNGVLIDDATWAPADTYTFTAVIPQSILINGTNTISVSAPLDGGISADQFLINWFEITYNQRYIAAEDMLVFSGDTAGTWEYHVDAFTVNDIAVFDVSTPVYPIRILGGSVVPTDSTYKVIFQQTIPAAREYIALTSAQRRTPKAIVADVPSDLLLPTNGADYIMIAHSSLITPVQPLADYYTGQGLRVQVVDVAEIYDAFSYGIFNPDAIRNFLAYAYTSWTRPAPVYVLLMGDGHYDFKDYIGRGETVYIPPYLADIDPWLGETAADNRYVAVSGDDILPDISLGRFPVKTPVEASTMINKALGYLQNPPTTEWNREILFVADNPDDAGDFYAYSNAVADQFVPPLYNAQKVYYLQPPYTTASLARTAMFNAINAGRLIVNYVGHAAYRYWASEKLLQITDIASMNNADKLTFMAPMTCLEGYYINPSSSIDLSAIAEMLVRAPDKAAIASWSPTGLGLASGHDVMNKALYQAIFYDHIIELGPATTLGKLALAGQGHDELIDTYTLFGDPALELAVLKADLSITKTVQTTPPTALFPETITYTLTYRNAGPSTAYNVVITDVLPAGLENPVVVSSGMTITQRTGTSYVWDVADLPMGTGGIITITATVAPTFRGVLDNLAEIASDVLDRYKNNNSSAVQTPVGVGPAVTITKSGSNVRLTWYDVMGASWYRVYRSTEAYFVPSPGNAIATVTASNYTDTGKIGDPSVNYFYIVTALDAQERESLPSNAVGEFDFALLPGEPGSTRYNVIALPLDVTAQLINAAALAGYIGDSVQQVLHWDPGAQSYEAWLPPYSVGTNFPLRVGHVYWVQVNNNAPSVLSFVGGVPPQNTVRFNLVGSDQTCLFNELSLPLDQTGITSATALAEALGAAYVEQALHWRADVHAFEFWLPEIDFGVDLATRVGYPYHVCLKAGAPVVWP